jgi:hypothetical protein
MRLVVALNSASQTRATHDVFSCPEPLHVCLTLTLYL